MKWSLKVKANVEREIRDLPSEVLRVQVLEKIGNLAGNPLPIGSKKLKGGSGNLHRLRVGDFLVVYAVDPGSRTVEVVRVRHRKDVYRGF